MSWDVYIAGTHGGGNGAWATHLRAPDGRTVEASAVEPGASQARMDLKAAVEALGRVDERQPVRVHTSSQLLVDTAERYLAAWAANGWRKRGGSIANLDLVRELHALLGRREVRWVRASEPVDLLDGVKDAARRAREAAPAPSPVAPKTPLVDASARRIVIYTDGGCRGNPGGVGGWGCLLLDVRSGAGLERRGGHAETTNNRMELTGALEGLRAVRGERQSVEIRSDSKYLIDICSKWMVGWKRNGWAKKDGEPIKNLDLVQALEPLLQRHDVHWQWVRGHSGEAGNEYVDGLANTAMDEIARGGTGADEQRHAVAPVAFRP